MKTKTKDVFALAEMSAALAHIAVCDSPRLGPESQVAHLKRVAKAALDRVDEMNGD